MATTALRIGVVGGSIAGCAMAVAGIRAGADVTVYERSDGELQDRGFGIVIPPPLHEELVAAGYLDAAMPTAPVASRIWVTRQPGRYSGREFARQASAVTPCNWGLLWRSLRANTGGARYLRGRPVTGVGHAPSGRAVIRTADGEELYDIVVGADGHESPTRQLLAPGLRPTPAGYRVWRGTIALSTLAGHRRELELLREAWVTLCFRGGHGIFYLIPAGSGGVTRRGESRDRLLAYAIYGRPPASGVDVGTYVRDIADEHFPAAWADIVARGEHVAMACHPVVDIQVPRTARSPFLLAGDAAGSPGRTRPAARSRHSRTRAPWSGRCGAPRHRPRPWSGTRTNAPLWAPTWWSWGAGWGAPRWRRPPTGRRWTRTTWTRGAGPPWRGRGTTCTGSWDSRGRGAGFPGRGAGFRRCWTPGRGEAGSWRFYG